VEDRCRIGTGAEALAHLQGAAGRVPLTMCRARVRTGRAHVEQGAEGRCVAAAGVGGVLGSAGELAAGGACCSRTVGSQEAQATADGGARWRVAGSCGGALRQRLRGIRYQQALAKGSEGDMRA
jgi:hypothetical protein